MRITVGILTVAGHEEEGEDPQLVSNAAVRALEHAGYTAVRTRIIDCDFQQIKSALSEMRSNCDVIFTTGGTGFAPDEVTPEVTAQLIDRTANGIEELMRAEAHKRTETSHLHRGVAGISGDTVIINLPNSAENVKQGIETVTLLLRPMVSALKGSRTVQDVH